MQPRKAVEFRRQTSPVRLILVVVSLLFSAPLLAQALPQAAQAALRALSPAGTEPAVATSRTEDAARPTRVFAVVFPTEATAQLVVLDRDDTGAYRPAARSRRFPYSAQANYGASMEAIHSTATDRFAVEFSFRQGCARGSSTHRFAFRSGQWVTVGLDRTSLKCTDDGVEQDWRSSENFLAGQREWTRYVKDKPVQSSRKPTSRRAFPIEAFPPSGPDYQELQ
ncbi:MAG TPA: hypothetical protein VIO81_13485 [Methyloversatilis sp.]